MVLEAIIDLGIIRLMHLWIMHIRWRRRVRHHPLKIWIVVGVESLVHWRVRCWRVEIGLVHLGDLSSSHIMLVGYHII